MNTSNTRVTGKTIDTVVDFFRAMPTFKNKATLVHSLMKLGAFYYIVKPFRLDEVRKVVDEALEKIRLKRENSQLREQIAGYEGKVKIITQDPAMLKLLEMARQVAPTDCNVLITGESGTGKELFARYLHYNSGRAESPFLALNCGAFGEELLSNEMFGHEKGAFTGALTLKKGLIESAQGGTLFLDEITEMSPAMQVKLLRVIQEHEVLRLGGTVPVKTDARISPPPTATLRPSPRTARCARTCSSASTS